MSVDRDKAVAWLRDTLVRDGKRGLLLHERDPYRDLLCDKFPTLEDDQPAIEAIIDAALDPSARPRTPTPAPAPAARRPTERRGEAASGKPPPPVTSDPAHAATYRFVALNDKVVPPPATVDRMTPAAGGFCGRITVEWAAETPLLIGVEDRDSEAVTPMRLGAGGPHVLPGASLRGMLRAAMEIVAHGRLSQVNRHHRYGLRDFDHPAYRKSPDGRDRLAWSEIGAGWLSKRPASDEEKRQAGEALSDYVLTPCDKKLIHIWKLPEAPAESDHQASGTFQVTWVKKSLREKLAAAGYATGGGREKLYDFTPRHRFAIDPEAADHLRAAADGPLRGTLVFSGKSPTLGDLSVEKVLAERQTKTKGNAKKREVVFLDRPGAPALRLTAAEFRQFELVHCKPSKNKPQPDGSFAELFPTLEAGRRIPVFHTGTPGSADFAMGLTRVFKIGHRATVSDVLDREQGHRLAKPFSPDFVEALFGHLHEPDDLGLRPGSSVDPRTTARKGRAAFGFATIDAATPAVASAEISTVMMGPRASFAPFYLRGPEKDWSSDHARLAGRKRYFPQHRPADRATAADEIARRLAEARGNGNTDTLTRLTLLRGENGQDLVFTGQIRLHNVLPEEVGALLWVLTHGGDPAKPFRHMLGRAKTVGAGQMRVRSLHLDLRGNDAAACRMLAEPAGWERLNNKENGEIGWLRNGQGMAPFLCAFENYMRSHVAGWPEVAPVTEWLALSDPAVGAAIVEQKLADSMALPQFRALRKNAAARAKAGRDPDRYLGAPQRPAGKARFPYRP